ncbi:Conserved hypothetical protein [Shewanella piezotolerans WP3]|uniref:ATP-grasp domain-containing protein n=1 Tax=Shewanella piezotolerans (strain WP3 / JCM 13877) TaxID=225849 RepID=B8CTR0_SHEPW|nr:ATP-grasp domain-containing protein [Shewanella piezotolerans]ACJ31304.1 Conserved hypothetical protein [Shewanella piezotolerans WP3]
MKNVILLGVRNFDFFSECILASINKLVVCVDKNTLPDQIKQSSTIIEVPQHYNCEALTYEMCAEEIYQAIRLVCGTERIDAVFCNQESNLVTAKTLRKMLNAQEPLNIDMPLFRNKILMKEKVDQALLRVPHFVNGTDFSTPDMDHQSLSDKIGTPYIVKPCSSVGSRGIFKIENQAGFDLFMAQTADDGCVYQAEEFIDGILYHCDMVIQNGKFLFQYACRYSCPNAEFQDGKILGSFLVDPATELATRLNDFSAKCITALGKPNGCFHMEVFAKTDGELVFLEVAARSPGLSIVPIYQNWLGFNLYDIELTVQMGNNAQHLLEPAQNFKPIPFFYAVLPKRDGKIKQLHHPKISSDFDIQWYVDADQELANTSSNLDFAGKVLVTNPCPKALEVDFDYICQQYTPISYDNTQAVISLNRPKIN